MKPSQEFSHGSLLEAMCQFRRTAMPVRVQPTSAIFADDAKQNKETRDRVIEILQQALDLIDDIDADVFD